VFVSAAKALLLDKSVSASTQSGVIDKFQENFVVTGDISLGDKTFQELVLQINQNEPSQAFAKSYIADAQAFLGLAKAFREELVIN
jgi:sulfite reductase (ferredoxin)